MRVAKIKYDETVRSMRGRAAELGPVVDQFGYLTGSSALWHDPANVAESRKRAIAKRTLALNGVPIPQWPATEYLVALLRSLKRTSRAA